MSINEALHYYFGFTSFKSYQKPVIESVLEGNSTLAVFPTGAGKSLCFQLPALLKENLTIVVSPLIALMKDQVDFLKSKKIPAERLDSSLSVEQYTALIKDIKTNKIKILYVSPERFNNERFRYFFQQVKVSLFVIDEAHCISEWGHNFRPEYLKLPIYAEGLRVKTILALTATANPKVQNDICNSLKIDKQHTYISGFFRQNLKLNFSVFDNKEHQNDHLIDKLKKNPPGATIIYTTLQKTTEELTQILKKYNIAARPYHAGMSSEIRQQNQDWFLKTNNPIMISTIAFGMGVDKSDIRYIYHYNLPKSLESYAQEIGRAGRDQKNSYCEVLSYPHDINTLENFIYGDMPNVSNIHQFLEHVFSQKNNISLKLSETSRQFDIKINVLRTILTYLELNNLVKSIAPIYTEYKFEPNLSSKEILNSIPVENKHIVYLIFKNLIKRRKFFTIKMDELITQYQINRGEIIRVLNLLADTQMINLLTKGIAHQYQLLTNVDDISLLTSNIFNLLNSREDADLMRIQSVMDLINLNSCQSIYLSNYFGEHLSSPCGQCHYCMSCLTLNLKRSSDTFTFSIEERNVLQNLLEELPTSLYDSRNISKILVGLNSPFITKFKYNKHPIFGKYSDIPFNLIESNVKKEMN